MEIKKLPFDQNKRHLIIGDIHGRYDELVRLLEKAKYDPEKDIVYSVGDMIDRGPKSYEVVDFFTSNENVYATKGNHELMACDSSWHNVWLNNGGVDCLYSLQDNDVTTDWLTQHIEPLPMCIEVGDDDEEYSFRIVHAEFPAGWTDTYFYQLMKTIADPDHHEVSKLIWSRNLIKYALARGIDPSIETTFAKDRHRMNFVGHTPLKEVTHVHDHWFVDTMNYGLSMIDAVTKETFFIPN